MFLFLCPSHCSDSRGTGVGSFTLAGISDIDLTDAQLYVGMFAPALFPLPQPQPQPQPVDASLVLQPPSRSSAHRPRSLEGSIDFRSASPGLWRTFESYHSGWWQPRYRLVSYDGRVLAEGRTRRMRGGECVPAVAKD